MSKTGKLYICGTPIGNLEDITCRAIRVLSEVDLIAAEDTRRTKQLLNYYNINTSLTSYHEHNEKTKSHTLIKETLEGKDLALVSDAGMPGISDPGEILIKRAINEGIEIIPVPGPTAVISALVVSGLPTDKFTFLGFLPRQGQERKAIIQEIQKEDKTLVVYESPYRLLDTLKEFQRILEDRKVAVVRELTKLHEEKYYGTIDELLRKLNGQQIKGEIVIVIQGRPAVEVEIEGWEEISILEHVRLMMEHGLTKKEAIKEISRIREIPKRDVYKEAMAINVNP